MATKAKTGTARNKPDGCPVVASTNHMDFKYPPILRCSPEQAGFDGAKGIGLNNKDMPDGGFFRLRRGSKDPRQDHNNDFRNQLIWFTPSDQSAQLLWCNSDGAWFTCIFECEDPAQ